MIQEETEFINLPKGLQTYGDLKKVINSVVKKQKLGKIGNVALDAAVGAIPGVGAAKTGYDFIKAAFGKPDTKKTNTWLDKLDVDDQASAILDDTIENSFIKKTADQIQQVPDDTPLDPNFTMNDKLVRYLSKKFNSRTLKNLKENYSTMKISELKNIIKQEILAEQTEKSTPQVQNINRLKQVLNLDQKEADALRKAAVQGLKPNPTVNGDRDWETNQG